QFWNEAETQGHDGQSPPKGDAHGANNPGVNGRLLEPFDDVEEYGGQEDSKKRDAQHAAKDSDTQASPHLKACPGTQKEWYNAENEGERGHQDGPEPQAACCQRGFVPIHAGLILVFGELDNEDGILTGQPDQDDEADLGEDVDITPGGRDAGQRAQ